MNFSPCHVVFVLTAGVLLPAADSLGAYNPAIVSADARWVVYADFDGLRASTIGREVVAEMEKAQAQTTGGTIGLDIPKVLKTIGSLTAYGTNLSKDPKAIDGALIAQGTVDLRKILESVLLQGTLAQPEVFSEFGDLPFPAYAISDPKAKGAPEERMQVLIAFPPEPIVVLSKSKTQLMKARDVFLGKVPSLAKAGGTDLKRLAPKSDGAYLFAASVVPTETLFPQNAPQARILQLASSGALALGESGADTFVHADLLASSEQSAEKLMKILQGMTAMLSLAESTDRQVGEFLNATSVSRDKDTVTLHLAYPSARLVQLSQNLRSKMEDHRPPNRQPSITAGQTLAEWQASEVPPADSPAPDGLSWRTIENVKLTQGSTITVGRALNGGKPGKFDRVEIVAADGSGVPLTFRIETMRQRGSLAEFAFPGVAGVYTLKVAFLNDPEGKARFAVSVRHPGEPEQAPRNPSKGPVIPQPKSTR